MVTPNSFYQEKIQSSIIGDLLQEKNLKSLENLFQLLIVNIKLLLHDNHVFELDYNLFEDYSIKII